MKKIPYQKYFQDTKKTEVGSTGWTYKLAQCLLCDRLIKRAGIRQHIYYKHFYERGNEYDWRN